MGKVFWKRNIPYLLIILNIDIDIKTLIFHFEFLHGKRCINNSLHIRVSLNFAFHTFETPHTQKTKIGFSKLDSEKSKFFWFYLIWRHFDFIWDWSSCFVQSIGKMFQKILAFGPCCMDHAGPMNLISRSSFLTICCFFD